MAREGAKKIRHGIPRKIRTYRSLKGMQMYPDESPPSRRRTAPKKRPKRMTSARASLRKRGSRGSFLSRVKNRVGNTIKRIKKYLGSRPRIVRLFGAQRGVRGGRKR